MRTVTFSAARANFAKTLNLACASHEPLVITRRGAAPVVLLSLDDYRAWQETAYLLSTSANANRLISAVDQLSRDQDQA